MAEHEPLDGLSQEIIALISADHEACPGSERTILAYTDDLGVISAEKMKNRDEYEHPIATYYRPSLDGIVRESLFSYGSIDYRLSVGDGWNIDAEYQKEGSALRYKLAIKEDQSIGITALFDESGKLYMRYQKSFDDTQFPRPRLVSLMMCFDEAEAEKAEDELYTRYGEEGIVLFDDKFDDDRIKYWEEMKGIFLFPQPDPVEWFVERGEEQVMVQGKKVDLHYSKETDAITIKFDVDGKEQIVKVPYQTDEIRDIKSRIVENPNAIDLKSFSRDIALNAFAAIGISLPTT